MELICDVEVLIDAERVVPRYGRAEWLQSHGIPDDKLMFLAQAPAKLWTNAGCHLNTKGQVKRISQEAIDALCIPARDLVKDFYPENRISEVAVEEALRKAASRRSRLLFKAKHNTQAQLDAIHLANEWIDTHAHELTSEKLEESTDPRQIVLNEHWRNFIEFVGVEPIVKNPQTLLTRHEPALLALAVRESLIDAVKDFFFPKFIKASVLEVARLTNAPDGRPFATVVPIKFEVAGCDPIVSVWDAEKAIP